MADYGLKVSKDGKDVSSSTVEDFVFSSKWSTTKIIKEGSGTVTVGASSNATKTIRHDLGFIPLCDLYFEPTPGSGQWRFGGAYYDTDDTYLNPGMVGAPETYVDNISLVFNFVNSTASEKIVKYYYFIYSDPI